MKSPTYGRWPDREDDWVPPRGHACRTGEAPPRRLVDSEDGVYKDAEKNRKFLKWLAARVDTT